MTTQRDALLVLEDGRAFRGVTVGAGQAEAFGEVVFNTSHTGYQEIASDPSYCGQIVCYTACEIGNYGACAADEQAPRPALSGVVLRAAAPRPSSYRATESFFDWLARHGIAGIAEVDTRALTRHLRERGAMRGAIFSGTRAPLEELAAKVRQQPSMEGLDLASRVSTVAPYTVPAEGGRRYRVSLLDFGVKRAILRHLARRHIECEVLPQDTPAEEVLRRDPDGIVLSNGPGDPAAVHGAQRCVRELIGKRPLLGICLGHQILALALGARTYKLRFGHHGGNHPVHDLVDDQVWITAQNHGFAVDEATLPEAVQRTQISLYDRTLEGFAWPDKQLLAVQFHPEGAPGPSDAQPVFDRFVSALARGRPDA